MKQRLTKGELLRRRHVMRRPITAIHVELWPLAFARKMHEQFYCNCRYAAATRWPTVAYGQLGGLAPHDLDVLFQVRLGLSGLRAPVSPGVWAVS
jgi:hypothetical protein